jgi:hypothetical protein
MVLSHVQFRPGFLSGAGFPVEEGICSSVLLELRIEIALAWFSFPLEHLKIREKNALREILLQKVSAKVK